MNKSIALALVLSISSLNGVQKTKSNYGYAKRLAGLIVLTLLFKKVTPQKYCDQLVDCMQALGPLLTVSVMYPLLIQDMNYDESH